jgi:hypothetical protein
MIDYHDLFLIREVIPNRLITPHAIYGGKVHSIQVQFFDGATDKTYPEGGNFYAVCERMISMKKEHDAQLEIYKEIFSGIDANQLRNADRVAVDYSRNEPGELK